MGQTLCSWRKPKVTGLWASSVFIIKASYLLEVGMREDILCRN